MTVIKVIDSDQLLLRIDDKTYNRIIYKRIPLWRLCDSGGNMYLLPDDKAAELEQIFADNQETIKQSIKQLYGY